MRLVWNSFPHIGKEGWVDIIQPGVDVGQHRGRLLVREPPPAGPLARDSGAKALDLAVQSVTLSAARRVSGKPAGPFAPS